MNVEPQAGKVLVLELQQGACQVSSSIVHACGTLHMLGLLVYMTNKLESARTKAVRSTAHTQLINQHTC